MPCFLADIHLNPFKKARIKCILFAFLLQAKILKAVDGLVDEPFKVDIDNSNIYLFSDNHVKKHKYSFYLKH
jgi:hypothetical protein